MNDDPFVSATDTPKTDESEVKRDRYGRYLLPPLKNASGKEIPRTRATTFCKSVSDTFGLMQWSNRMVAKGVALRPDLYALASATDVTDKKTFDKLAEDAKQAAGATSAASLGTALHSFTEAVDRGEDPEVPLQWKADIEAYKKLMNDAALEIPSWAIERIVTVERFGIAGTFDRLAKVTKRLEVGPFTLEPGDWVVLDVKTGKDLKFAFNEISIQLGLYAHADAIWNGTEIQFEEMPDVRQDVGLVVHLPVGKGQAELYALDIESGWNAAELCEQVRNWRKVRGLAHKVPGVGNASWEDRINSAQSRQELSAIWNEASAAGQWTSKLEKMGKARLTEIER